MRRRQFLQWTGITLAAAATGAQASRADLRAGGMAHAGLSPPTGAAAFRAARRCFCTGRRATASSGAARSIGCPPADAAWHPISWASDTPRFRRLAGEAIDYYAAPLVSSPLRRAQYHAFHLALEPNPLAGIEAALKRSAVPLRIVWGAGDDIFAPADADYLDRTFPRSRGIRHVPGAKLFFPEEFPGLVAAEARRLWRVG
ncbi:MULTISPECIES: alpha/beta hydrolase [unclassified Rhodanobacter]|uniref:alpha/beta fold hydrolase n=1 Tax=unclassified Rhodanobacter TaxID=2621553 RepID=UPI002032AB6A|nr:MULTISPECIES: alpha/beta hydrolase [unclassified Rhodanobacter]